MGGTEAEAQSQRWLHALAAALAPESEEPSADELVVREMIAFFQGCYLRPEDWQAPYGPMFTIGNRRSKVPDDLTEEELHVLRAIAPALPTRQVRIQALDVLAVRSAGTERFEGFLAMVTAVADDLDVIEFDRLDIEQCERAIMVALRFSGPVGAQGQRIEDALLTRMLGSEAVSDTVAISDLFLAHGRARSRAVDIAGRFRQLSETADAGTARTLLEASANWRYVAGDQSGAFDETVWIVESLIAEATALLDSDRPEAPLHAQEALENALKTLRTIPKPERAARRLLHLDAKIKTGIDAATAQASRMLTALPPEETDLTEEANRVRDLVRGRPIEEAVHILLRPTALANYEDVREAVEGALRGSVTSLFPTIHLSSDGRIAAQTGHSADAEVFGVPSDVWQMMMQVYERRIDLTVVGRILPAWRTMSNEHKFRVSDFHALTRRSPIVPAGREYSIAVALAHGYNGDFFTAAQLLAPQVENLVRVHLANAGAVTRSYVGGVQNEIGLSGLMEKDEAVTIFGPDVAFEIGALFCSALGPNLRNEYAHGLVGDWGRGSHTAVYAWWLVWKLLDEHFVNAIHDLRAAESREPAAPSVPGAESM